MITSPWTAKFFCFGCALALGVGCAKSTPTSTAPVSSNEGAAYLLLSEPPAAKSVIESRADSSDTSDVTLVGRIGGDENPWVRGQAAFFVVDESLKPCNEKDDDACETPWDYCCDTDELRTRKALVKVVDSSGKTVAKDARNLLGLKELQTVVVRGKAKRDEAGNLTVLADGIFVRN